jgi:antirestriction protein ArdC
MTYRQAQSLGGQVRSGEQSQFAIFYKAYSKKFDSCERPGELVDEQRRVMRSYAIFNADQIDALPEGYYSEPLSLAPPGDRLCRRAQCFVDRLPARLRSGGDRAYYDLRADLITMPTLEQFDTRAAWAATLAHEAGHWTGHPARLARSFGKRFGDQAYAFEELVAELTAALVGAEVGLPTAHLDDHAAYIGSWLAIFRRDNRALLTAAARAEDAAGFLLRATDLAGEEGFEELEAA